MAVYAVGDVQGCHEPLARLLDRIRFDPASDRLWFTGDLVNRGPESLAVLRMVRALGDAAVSVLGNHDLHLLAIARGLRPPRADDHLDAVLEAHDRDELVDWLRRRPLLHHDAALGWVLVHAGVPPVWDLTQAKDFAREVEQRLRGDGMDGLLKEMYGDTPARWEEAGGEERARYIINAFTRMRYWRSDGGLDLRQSGAPGTQPAGLVPWFAVPERRNQDVRIVFGHWSTLGLYRGHNVLGVDTGCLWGGSLSAVRLDAHEQPVTAIACDKFRHPGESR